MRRAGALITAACCGLLLAACVPEGLAFRVDKRLTITSPEDGAEVTLPLTLSWDVRDFAVVSPGAAPDGQRSGYFAVLVDQAPPPPGKGLAWLARKDRACRPADGCPDARYLGDRYVFTTSDTSLTFEQLPRPGHDSKRKERHAITVILLDPSGHRIGESAFEVDVVVRREGAR